MGSVGFGPTKAEPTDLQSAPFDRSGNSPKIKKRIAISRDRTVYLEITSHALCQVS